MALAPWNWDPYDDEYGNNLPLSTRRRGYHPFHHAWDLDPFEIPSQLLTDLTTRPLASAGRTTEFTNTDDQFRIGLDVQGFKPDELNVKCVRDRYLVVQGKKAAVQEGEGAAVAQAQEFTKSFMVPRGVDIANLKSNLKRGVLTIQAPKQRLPAVENERSIAIQHQQD